MKKLLTIVLAAAMLLSLVACGGDKEEESSKETVAAEQDGEKNEESNELSYDFSEFGKGRITIVGSEFVEDEEGAEYLRVYYDYTNTSENTQNQSPDVAVSIHKITQNGKELDTTWFSDMDEIHVPEDLNGSLSAMPGHSVRNTMIIPCSAADGVVEISCYVMIGNWMYTEDKLELFTFQVDPENLMGAPAKALEYTPITDPSYTEGWATSGSTESPIPFEVSINDWELANGYEGGKVLRVNLTVKNLDAEAWTPGLLASAEAFQDGVSLPEATSWDLEESTEEDDAISEYVEQGDSIDFNALFLLRNENPVEIVIEQGDDLKVGMICDIAAVIKAENEADKAATEAASKAEAEVLAAMAGSWTSTDGWGDVLVFNADKTGIHDLAGDQYPFSYTLEGDYLTLNYDDGDVSEYTITVDKNELILTDYFGDTIPFARTEADSTEETEDSEESEEDAAVSIEEFMLGTWVDHESGYEETFTFNADGTGVYSFVDGGYYEYTYTYEFPNSGYVEFHYDDGDEGEFGIKIKDDNTILVSNVNVTDMPLVRE
ncbi:MAG: DUF5067 domain-containing protein [Firmicutes bacterium]|nr:DUF5067 domain-containing protein [Bacillota bacterium]